MRVAAGGPPVLNWSGFDGDAGDWDAALGTLEAGSFYQSHAWGEYRRAMGWQPTRIVCRDGNGAVAAMAQILVRRQAGATVVWVPGGPAGDTRHWAAALPAFLRARFGMASYCRLNILREGREDAERMLAAGGWRRPRTRLGTGLSLELDLLPAADARIQAMTSDWRRNLRRSGKQGLVVEPWPDPDAAAMAAVYREMEDFKGLAVQHSEVALSTMARHLGQRLVMFRCLDQEGQLLAFRAAGIFGERAWDLMAAATRAARKVSASHALLWAVTEACRRQGAAVYDLGGADPDANWGVFDFKRGIGARLFEYTGEWEWAGLPLLGTAAGLAMKYRGMAA